MSLAFNLIPIANTKYNFILDSDFYYYLVEMDYAQEAINQHRKYR